jgi:hypothetical protein
VPPNFDTANLQLFSQSRNTRGRKTESKGTEVVTRAALVTCYYRTHLQRIGFQVSIFHHQKSLTLDADCWNSCMARARRRRAVCQVGDLFGLNTGRGPCRGPCRRAFRLRLGEPQCLGRHLQILRVSDPHIAVISSRAAAGPRPGFRPNSPPGWHTRRPRRRCQTTNDYTYRSLGF